MRCAGKSYLTLFVDEPERYQSKEDCDRIINNDYVQHNCLAYDRSKDKKSITMLTNCFRVYDTSSGEYLQAEVGLEVSDLTQKEQEHRSIREVGIAQKTNESKIIELTKDMVKSNLSDLVEKKLRLLEKKKAESEGYKKTIEDSIGKEKAEEITGEALKSVEEQIADLIKTKIKYMERIMKENNLEALKEIEEEIYYWDRR